MNNFSFEAHSVSSFSTESGLSLKKTKPKIITKNKCMIMERIFKNAVKSKPEDEFREIPVVDNSKLVEDYVMQLPTQRDAPDKPKKMTEQEINTLFDKLLENKNSPGKKQVMSDKTSEMTKANTSSKTKSKTQNNKRRRQRHNSESTDDEFNIYATKKRNNKKKMKPNDDCINLEQELKECIGVASRKSQRKCTSGKQNVLAEIWSSDESNFETFPSEERPKTQVVDEASQIGEKIEKILENQDFTIPVSKLIIPRIEEIPHHSRNEAGSGSEKPTKIEKSQNAKQNRRKSTTKHSRNRNDEDKEDRKLKKIKVTSETLAANRRKRPASDTLYYWSSSSEDESQDLIEVKPIREEMDEDDNRPMQHGWIVGDSPKKLVTMLAQAKGKKVDAESVKEQGKKRTTI